MKRSENICALILFFILLTSGTFLLAVAEAAAVGNAYFAQATTLRLTISGTTRDFTINAVSDADSLTVNPSSFTVQISAGQRFIVTSAQRLIFANDSNVATICEANNTSTFNLTGTKTVVVTPDGSQCPASGGGGGGGDGGGVAASPTALVTPQPTSSVAPTASATPTIVVRATVVPGPPATGASPAVPTGAYAFKRGLKFGMSSNDVKALQDFLRTAGFYHSPASTGFFDSPTKQAVIAWQKANGIEPASGVFGPLSIGRYKKLTATAGGQALAGQVTVTGGIKYLNVRAKPSLSGKIVARVYPGDILRIVGSQGNWYQVEKNRQTLGWVAKQYLSR